ncbi:MAG: TetR/AcrR family transcriptional regulator [Solobacterium sp.]|nr:TetR/AcrR family transcriptional regulator [Solobacterium sp.]
METGIPKAGKVALNQQLKRNALLEAGKELFMEKGIGATTINEIADKAGIGKGTFYIYFEDKYEVARELVNIAIREKLAVFFESDAPADSGNINALMMRLSDDLVDYIAEDPMQRKLILDYISLQIRRPEIVLPEEHLYMEKLPAHFDARRFNILIEAVLEFTCFFACALLEKRIAPEYIKPRIHRVTEAIIKEFE